jgi:hypothetical protein
MDFDFRLNFNELNFVYLQQDKITLTEIVSVYHGDKTTCVWHALNKDKQLNYYIIGFSDKYRFLEIFLRVDGEEVVFVEVNLVKRCQIIVNRFFNKL